MRGRSVTTGWWLSLLFVATVLCVPLDGQVFDPNFRLYFSDGMVGGSESTIPVECLFDSLPGAADLAGWSFGICHDPTLVAPMSAVASPMVGMINGGSPPDFIDVAFDPVLGVTMGVVICFACPNSLGAPQAGLPLAIIDYELIGPEGSETELLYCDTVAIGGNPVATILVTTGGGQRIPILDPGPVSILASPFVRGDCDRNGTLGIADPIVLLGFLFSGDPSPGCLDACDWLDGGTVNIADPINMLNYLFSGGPPPPPPFPNCGIDPTPDSFGCEVGSPTC